MGAHWARGQWGGGGRAGRRRNGESALRPSTPSLQTAHVSGELRARGCSPHPPHPRRQGPLHRQSLGAHSHWAESLCSALGPRRC